MNLEVFRNSDFGEVRVVVNEKTREPWFVAKDVVDILGLKNITETLKRVDVEDLTSVKLNSGGQMRDMKLINESGVYQIIFMSRKPEAKKFKRWVTSEVLPSIRKHGMYAKDELLDNPDLLLEVVTKLKDERDKRLEAEKQRDEVKTINNRLMFVNKTYTTTEIAKELGFKSAIQLNKKLAEMKIQYKQNGTWVLYSDYANLGYTVIKQEVLENGKTIYNRHWSQAGRDFILSLF
jgi:prophage antirepressor-like protein